MAFRNTFDIYFKVKINNEQSPKIAVSQTKNCPESSSAHKNKILISKVKWLPIQKKVHFMNSNYPRNLLIRFYSKVLFHTTIFVSSAFFGMDRGEVRGDRDYGLAKVEAIFRWTVCLVYEVISARDTNYDSPRRQKNTKF